MKESRRQFLKKSGCAMGMATIASQMGYLGMMNAFAQTCSTVAQPSDYKALVLVFLAGGNDGNNMVIPNHGDFIEHTGYDSYAAQRGDVAIPQNQLRPIIVPAMAAYGNTNYGLHPNMGQDPPYNGSVNPGLHDLWGAGKMAIVTNVGTLVQPTNKTQYQNSTHPKPRQLFSHSDQIEQQQSAYSNGTDYKGWGGRISCKMSPTPDRDLPMMTSIAGSQLFITGGPTPLVVADGSLNSLFKFDHTGNIVNPAIDQAFKDIVAITPGATTSKFVKQANSITTRAITASSFPPNYDIDNPEYFPVTGLGKQLLQVARIIKLSRSTILPNPPKRQIFFCQLGGFDTHAYQMSTQASLIYQFSQAVRAFYNEMVHQQISNNVTTFTMSDFSRTFSPNGNGASAGTDHAWANHMFVVGGSVKGGDFYGVNTSNGTPYPTLSVGGDDDEGSFAEARGRWIPTTAVEEYAGVLAEWFGLPGTEMVNVFPNYNNFTLSPTRTGNLKFF